MSVMEKVKEFIEKEKRNHLSTARVNMAYELEEIIEKEESEDERNKTVKS